MPFLMPYFAKKVGAVVCAVAFILPIYQSALAQSNTVDPSVREQSVEFYRNEYSKSATVSPSWNGSYTSCNPGSTASTYRATVLQRINYFRSMAGIPTVTFTTTLDTLVQPSALINSANNVLNHFPDPSYACYTPTGAQSAAKANLALGVHGKDAVSAYVQDAGVANGPAGHRRWLLYPQTRLMGSGDLPGNSFNMASNALYVLDYASMSATRPATRHEFVAWPPPGFVPYTVVFPRWSFSLPGADFSNATLTMVSNGVNLPIKKETIIGGYGENTLVWLPNDLVHNMAWPRPSVDTDYFVTINNVVVAGQSRNFSYKVTVIDVNEAPTALTLSASSLYENKLISTTVGYVKGVDSDYGDILTYSLAPGEGDTDNALFAIVSNRLKTKAVFDYETKSSFSIRVRVSDGRSGGTFEKAFIITIKDYNDKPTDIALNDYNVERNVPLKSTVGIFSTRDQDISSTFRYALVTGTGGTDNAKFYIISDTLKTNVVLTLETKINYYVRVRVYDNKGAYYNEAITLTAIAAPTGGMILTADAAAINEMATKPMIEDGGNDAEYVEQSAEFLAEPVEVSDAPLVSPAQPTAILMEAPRVDEVAPEVANLPMSKRVFLPVINN